MEHGETSQPSGLMTLVIGLGNPGETYRGTRHNIGFLVLDELARRESIPIDKKKYTSRYGKGVIHNTPVVLIKPETYMNLSGEAVGRFLRFYKAERSDIIVVHDDLDFPFGTVRIRRGGGDGGHKGVHSVIVHSGGSDFLRVRMGIGKPERKEMTEYYVLKHFSGTEARALPEIIDRACDAVVTLLCEGADAAMARFNSKTDNGQHQ